MRLQMARRSTQSRKPLSQASDAVRDGRSASSRDSARRISELEETLHALHAQVESNTRRLMALQAQLDHVTAKQRS